MKIGGEYRLSTGTVKITGFFKIGNEQRVIVEDGDERKWIYEIEEFKKLIGK